LYINPYQQIEIGINANTGVPQPEEFDICWFDLAITPDIDFFPETYMLPYEMYEFKN